MTTLTADPHERLEDGASAATPEGDNLLLDYARAEADAFGALATAVNGRVEHDDDLGVALHDTGVASPFGNTALCTAPVPADRTAELAARLQTFFGGGAGGPYLVFCPWPTGDLAPFGFHRVGHPPLMLRPAGGTAPVVPGLRIVAVDDTAGLVDFEHTLIEAYPAPEMAGAPVGTMHGPGLLDTRWRFFVGYEGDRPVATAAAWVAPTLTIVEQVATRDECRGKGYGAALTAAATFAEPANPAMLIASDPGRPVYDRLGYLPLLRYSLWLGLR